MSRGAASLDNSQFVATQPEDYCHECEQPVCICESVSQDEELASSSDEEEASPKKLKRSDATVKSVHFKSPKVAPDLFHYFSQFPKLTVWEKVGICRTFANYLCAQQKPSVAGESRIRPDRKY